MSQLAPIKTDLNLGISRSSLKRNKKKNKKNKSDPVALEQPLLVFDAPVQASKEVLEGRRIKVAIPRAMNAVRRNKEVQRNVRNRR